MILKYQVRNLRIAFSWFKNGPLGNGYNLGCLAVPFGFLGVNDFNPPNARVKLPIDNP